MQIYSSSYSFRFLIHPSLAQLYQATRPLHCSASVCLYYRTYHARIKVPCTGWAGLKAASGTQVRALQGTPVQSSAHQCTVLRCTALHCTGASGQTLQQEEHHRVHRIDILALLVHFSSYSWDEKLGVAFKVNLIRSQVGSKNASSLLESRNLLTRQ